MIMKKTFLLIVSFGY